MRLLIASLCLTSFGVLTWGAGAWLWRSGGVTLDQLWMSNGGYVCREDGANQSRTWTQRLPVGTVVTPAMRHYHSSSLRLHGRVFLSW